MKEEKTIQEWAIKIGKKAMAEQWGNTELKETIEFPKQLELFALK